MSSLADIPPEIDWSRDGSVPENITLGEGGWAGRLGFIIPWGYRYEFLDLVAGTDEVIETSPGVEVTRKVSLRHPERPNNFFAVGATCDGFGGYEGVTDGFGQNVMHSHARVVVDFATLPFGFAGDMPFASISVQHGSEYITIPNSAMVFSNSTRTKQDSGRHIVVNMINLTTYLNPTLDHVFLSEMSNKLNLTTFLGYAPGHVKCMGVSTDSPVSALGVVTHTKSMVFGYRELHWNYSFREDGELDIAQNVFTGEPPYEAAELNALLS